jgi:hypothetical protein
VLYLVAGLPGCLWASAGFVLAAAVLAGRLPTQDPSAPPRING